MSLTGILRVITVEPAVLLFSTAVSLIVAVQPEFIYFKKCYELRTLLNNDSEAQVLQYCRFDILQNSSSKSFRDNVQTSADLFSEYLSIASSVSAIFAALVIGAYSDRHGRKLPLMLSLCGNVLQNAYIIFLSALPSVLPLWSLIVVFCLSGFTGGSIVAIAASFSVVADHSPDPAKRAIRVSIVSGCIAVGFTTGSLLSIISASNYTLSFMISCGSFFLAFMYSVFVLKESLVDNDESNNNYVIIDLLVKPVQDMWRTLARQRPNGGHVLIGTAMTCFALVFSADFGLGSVTFLFLKHSPFFWNDYRFNVFMSILTLTGCIGMAIAALGFRLLPSLRPSTVAIAGGFCCGLRVMMLAISTQTWMVFLCCVFNTFAVILYPAYRTLVSLLVEPNETGRIFAVIASIENGTPILSSLFFNNIYLVTEKERPATVFWVAVGVQLCVCVVMSIAFVICRRNASSDTVHTVAEQLVDEANEAT